jgi:mRNA interferase HigB
MSSGDNPLIRMRVLNEQRLQRFAGKHPDTRQWLGNWVRTAREADWRTIQDVKRCYPATDGGVKVQSGVTVTIFDVCGNRYRLISRVIYAIGTVIVLDILTHAEYTTGRWKRRH